MPAPAFVNGGAKTEGTSGTATAVMPGSRVNGNLLIAYVQTTGGGVNFSIGGGWILGDQITLNSGCSTCFAYRYVDGSEADPSFTIVTGATTWGCQVYQYSGVVASVPIGRMASVIDSSTAIAVGSVKTTAANSLIIGMLFSVSNQTIPTPTSYTSRDSGNDAAFCFRICDESVATSGTATDAIAATITTAPWSAWMIELRSVAADDAVLYVNKEIRSSGASASATAALPNALVTGDLLISYVQVSGGNVTFTVDAGWTMGDQVAGPNGGCACWAYRYVNGAEAAPTFTLSGGTNWRCGVYQFSGVTDASPIGNKSSNIGFGTAFTVSAINSTADASLVLALLFVSGNEIIPVPTNYAMRVQSITNQDAGFANVAADETIATSGSASDAVSVTITSAAWAGFLIEVLHLGPPFALGATTYTQEVDIFD